MGNKDLRKSADIIYSICNKNGSNKLTGYFSTSPSNTWINNDGYLAIRSVTRNNNSIFDTMATVFDDNVIMKQLETKEDNVFYDLISWTADGKECTVVNFETKEDLEKVYKNVTDKYRQHINLGNIEQICNETGTTYSNIDYKKFDSSKKKESKITAASLVDELETRNYESEVKESNNIKVS